MSLIRRMFGLNSYEELKRTADKLYNDGKFGEAKLMYDRAKEQVKRSDQEVLNGILDRIANCRDELAKSRIAKAREFMDGGALDLATSELENAIETAASDEVIQKAKEYLDNIEEPIGIEQQIDEPVPLTDEERMVVISGSWEEEQAEEYEFYGSEFQQALILLSDGKIREGREILEELLGQAEDPHYLYFEVGRSQIMDDDVEKGVDTLRKFLTRIGPEEGGEARLVSHVEIARFAHEKDNPEGAIEQLENALKAMPKDPRPYLWMGVFFRQKGLDEEAIEVLESGINVMVATSEMHPDWRLFQELGLAYKNLGEDDKAIEYLEQVIAILAARQVLDLPPETATQLAQLYENKGNKARAADLYSMLAQGSDSDNYFFYYYQAGRILVDLGHTKQARRMLNQAKEIVPSDEPLKTDIASLLVSIENT